MLTLKNIYKNYIMSEGNVEALSDVSLEFRGSEFVAVLGASGSGKTTLLNLIGGLDKYTKGELLINGKSTKDFKSGDWDTYRNNTVGFIFQSYNLIPHLSVLGNVEIALTLSGMSFIQRRQTAVNALESVGLGDQINKKPNQLSGGQMQRVAIARALVNNPKIILADEPTGALDSVTGKQIMDILKEISKDRLIIMVTHNKELSDEYANRTISLVDGRVVDDSNPYDSGGDQKEAAKFIFKKKSSMSFFTALKLSFNNLKTKKARTLITSIAGSIGIIGVALVLAISSGTSAYVSVMQSDLLSAVPITIERTANIDRSRNRIDELYPEGDVLYPNVSLTHSNAMTADYLDYIENLDANLYNAINYNYGTAMNVVGKGNKGYNIVNVSRFRFQQLPDNDEFIFGQYELIDGVYPESMNQAVLVLDNRNRVDGALLTQLGIDFEVDVPLKFSDVVGHELKVVLNDVLYTFDEEEGIFDVERNPQKLFEDERNIPLTITGIIRIRETTTSASLGRGIAYTAELANAVREHALESDIVARQKESRNKNLLNGENISESEYRNLMTAIGGNDLPYAILIYPKSFAAKETIKKYLDRYNAELEDDLKIIYNDRAEDALESTEQLVGTITLILTAFASISLVVSSIMIGIITYVSVVERTREIGVLRSLGARKKDISRVFNAETVIIGFIAGTIGVVTALILGLPVNAIVYKTLRIRNISQLPVLYGFALVAASVALTFIAGFIPAKMAAHKDPVKALRTE